MARSLRNAFLSEAEKVIIIGTDCPGVNAQILATAFYKLHTFDFVLSPAIDGGYYLIGFANPSRSYRQHRVGNCSSIP